MSEESLIGLVVRHAGGPTAVSRSMGGWPVYQEVQTWVRRGWASPHHILKLRPVLPDGVSVEDLFAEAESRRRDGRGVSTVAQGASS